jgi:hypothetical protein
VLKMENLLEINRKVKGIEEIARIDKKTKKRVMRFLESRSG